MTFPPKVDAPAGPVAVLPLDPSRLPLPLTSPAEAHRPAAEQPPCFFSLLLVSAGNGWNRKLWPELRKGQSK